ncbi:MAG: YdcF family protein [Deltaproteobacteria bacterium]|nr:YdcF family protein [Deltaproteobacteria bacterium]
MKKVRSIWLSIVTVPLLCIIILFSLFINELRLETDEITYADAIVVLTGGAGRVEEGLRLFREGRGGRLILSGVEETSTLDTIFPGRDLKTSVDTSRIILDIESRSTIDNAINVKKIAEGRGFKSLVLVTSSYHMKRASTIFSKIISGDVKLYRHPVSGPNFKDEEWWQSRKSLKLVTSEFFKYIWFHIWQRWVF